jgi:alanyl-tRNA synthetase
MGRRQAFKQAFCLYDPLGFPVDLTQLMASERRFSVGTVGLAREMEEQKAR